MTEKIKFEWEPGEKPSENYCKRLRQYIAEAVQARWNNGRRASKLISIFYRVQDRIRDDIARHDWPNNWRFPSKRTIDRRVNEAADPKYCEDGVPKIVMVSKGVYMPNPDRVAKSEKVEMMQS